MNGHPSHRTVAFAGVKGGVGTTAVTLLAGTVARRHGQPSLLVDLTGDIATVVDHELNRAPGIAELLSGSGVGLDNMVIDLAEPFHLLPRGNGPLAGPADAWQELWHGIESHDSHAVVDAGRAENATVTLQHSSARLVLVTARCYQSYNRSVELLGIDRPTTAAHRDAQLVMVDSGYMHLDAFTRDLDRAPDALVSWSSAIGRWMDSGLILDRGLAAAGPLEHLVYPEIAAAAHPQLEDPDAIGL